MSRRNRDLRQNVNSNRGNADLVGYFITGECFRRDDQIQEGRQIV